MTIKMAGLQDTLDDLKKVGVDVEKALLRSIKQTAFATQSRAVKEVQRGSKTGITYNKSNPNRSHRASAPGEAPASDTGRLAGSIRAIINGENAVVGTDLKYGLYLEFGTMNISERPFLRPARDVELPKIIDRLKRNDKR